jgi:hypothetical protein
VRGVVLLCLLSGCSLIDAFTGAETPFTTFERVRLPNNRSVIALAAHDKMIAASGGPDVTFIEHRGNNNYVPGALFPMPDNRMPLRMAMGNLDGQSPDEAIILSADGIDVMSQTGVTTFCPLAGGTKVVAGDLDGDGNEDIAVLQGVKVTVFFGAGVSETFGLDCAAFVEVNIPAGSSITFAQSSNGARLFVLGQSDLIALVPIGDPKRMFDVNTLPGGSFGNGAGHIAVGDVDGDGEIDLLQAGFAGQNQLRINFRSAETFTVDDREVNLKTEFEAKGLVTFRNGDLDGVVMPRENPGGVEVVVPDGDDFAISNPDLKGSYISEVSQVFASDLDGDDIEDLITDGGGGDIVVLLSGG